MVGTVIFGWMAGSRWFRRTGRLVRVGLRDGEYVMMSIFFSLSFLPAGNMNLDTIP